MNLLEKKIAELLPAEAAELLTAAAKELSWADVSSLMWGKLNENTLSLSLSDLQSIMLAFQKAAWTGIPSTIPTMPSATAIPNPFSGFSPFGQFFGQNAPTSNPMNFPFSMGNMGSMPQITYLVAYLVPMNPTANNPFSFMWNPPQTSQAKETPSENPMDFMMPPFWNWFGKK